MSAVLLLVAAADVPDEHRWVVERLDAARFSARMNRTHLPDAVQLVADFSGVPIRFDEALLDDLDDADRTVTLDARNASARDILRVILRPRGLTLTIRDGAPTVVPIADLRRGHVMRIYDVRDLTRRIESFPADDTPLTDPRGPLADRERGVAVQFGDATLSSEDEDVGEFLDDLFGDGDGHLSDLERALALRVRDLTGGDSWVTDPDASIRFHRGRMIVDQSPGVHLEIRELLNRLRDNRSGDLRDNP